MGKAAGNESKHGYAAVPVVNAAPEAAQFMISGNKPVKPEKKPLPDEERSWEGHLCCCFGRCDAVGWSACCMSYFVPCFAFGCVQTNTQIFGVSEELRLLLLPTQPNPAQLRSSALCALVLGSEHSI